MSAGQQPDFSSDAVFNSRFPLHRACRDGDVGALVSLSQQLPNRAHLTAEDSCYGWTPMHWAAHYGQLECVVRLVQMGCEVNTVTSRFNQTPTHTAAFGGHPHCVVWLTQAGADVNGQDFVGEAPIHKAARSGSLECIQVLLIAGAKPHLRNANGQTAADLAHAHGFQDCVLFISKTQKHLLQLGGLHVNGLQNGNGDPCGPGLLSRKRLMTAVDTGHMKKAKKTDNVLVQTQSSEGEELESMNMDSAPELGSADDYNKAITNGHHHTAPYADQDGPEPPKSLSSPSSHPANQQSAAPAQHSFADMCGSLHLSSSPSSCVSHRPSWRGLTGADCGDFLHYGHYHGFGDTAEELSDSSHLHYSSGIQAEHKHKKAVASAVHLYHGS
ncbi:ankyrin repeat domain-containing protein 10a isoform X1 [Micropterus dolomieu]|uniref:ankyrin repeat domain-containing protein 10a isoform X1 n=1 Tax=Micropterus dolomieu TaxID=147949 RepID=UPI001E8E22FE|nr:ankyrin repeat domain-containing protein 10a isoform X1 [Micropterus dolomieu]XP_045908934.1 ankyrin repeat domain-containing protein 10a isoform X1 [Micropterus dolomieu]